MNKNAITWLLVIVLTIMSFIALDIRNQKIRLERRLSEQIERTEYYEDAWKESTADIRDFEAFHLRDVNDFKDFSRDIFKEPINDVRLYRVQITDDDFRLRRTKERNVRTIAEAVAVLNAEYNWEPYISTWWYGSDSITLHVQNLQTLQTNQELELYKAKVILTLTELEKVEYVEIARTGYDRTDFESKLEE